VFRKIFEYEAFAKSVSILTKKNNTIIFQNRSEDSLLIFH